jgi:plasmid stabilization system protein ParE
MIRLTQEASDDLAGIAASTTATWGNAQATRYIAEVQRLFELIESQPGIAPRVPGWPHLRCVILRGKSGRLGHGHRIFYSDAEREIVIVRILHTALNWTQILDRD